MVPNLPYFMVQFDHKGEKGYGHVIEGTGESTGQGDDSDEQVDEGGKGGGEFPRYVLRYCAVNSRVGLILMLIW